jgi:hypothetical protein
MTPWVVLAMIVWSASARAVEPIKPHPDNPRYFLFRGQPTFLITSGEHYGGVLNRRFDFVRYLDELRNCRFNLTRLFSGSYREIPGSFEIRDNTLAPSPADYLAPWARSNQPGAADGGNKFDLSAWNPAYFERLRKFITAAGERGIVVELVCFCPFYDEGLWAINPMNGHNNTADIGPILREEVFTLKHPKMLARQEALVQKLVTELHAFDNVYFEICNEPYFGGVTLDWQARICQVIVETEARLGGQRHMIAQNIANGRAKLDRPNPAVGLFNFHYATPPDVIALNAGSKRAFGDDETGFRGNLDRVYRTEAWEFLFAGGGLFNNLDYSFTVAHPDGQAHVKHPTPGGGGPTLRRQLTILRDFVANLDFMRMSPDRSWIKGGEPAGVTPYSLTLPGKVYVVYMSAGTHANLDVELPAGVYRAQWINPLTGEVEENQDLDHKGGQTVLTSPRYAEDIVLKLTR